MQSLQHGHLCHYRPGVVFLLTYFFAINGVIGTNFGVGVGEARPEGPRAGDGVLGEGQPAPPHQLGGFTGSVVSSPSGVWGRAPAAEGFPCILCCHIAVPSISVGLRVAYSYVGLLDFSIRETYISISPT